MLKNFNFKKNIDKFFKNSSRPFETEEINPSRDWRIIMVFFAFLTMTLIVFGFYMYWKISKGSLFDVLNSNELPVEIIDRAELKKVADYFETKSQLFEEIKLKKPQVVDPSL